MPAGDARTLLWLSVMPRSKPGWYRQRKLADEGCNNNNKYINIPRTHGQQALVSLTTSIIYIS